MTDWEVELLGHELDVENLGSLSQPPVWTVRKREKDGRYILTSAEFAGMSDAVAVRDYAHKSLLPVLNGALRLQYPWSLMGRIEIGTGLESEDQQGSRTGHRVIEQTASISVTEEITITDGSGNIIAAPAQSPSIVGMCTALGHDPTVRTALGHFSRGGQWTVDLYKVFEIIRDDAKTGANKSLDALGWATLDELDNFRSVHDPHVTGDLARHGVHDHQRKPPANPMDENTARAFIHNLLLNWILYRYQQLGHSLSTT